MVKLVPAGDFFSTNEYFPHDCQRDYRLAIAFWLLEDISEMAPLDIIAQADRMAGKRFGR